jgi:hypothetical protein
MVSFPYPPSNINGVLKQPLRRPEEVEKELKRLPWAMILRLRVEKKGPK